MKDGTRKTEDLPTSHLRGLQKEKEAHRRKKSRRLIFQVTRIHQKKNSLE